MPQTPLGGSIVLHGHEGWSIPGAGWSIGHQPRHLLTIVLPVANWSVEAPKPPSRGWSGPFPAVGRVGTQCRDWDALLCHVSSRLSVPAPRMHTRHMAQKLCFLGSAWFSLKPVGVLQSKHFRKGCFSFFCAGV